MSNPVRIVVGEGESAEIVVGENGSAEVEVPGYGIIAGRDGPPGPAGDDGKSAYQIAVDNGFVGTEEEWLESLVGPQGEPGADGTVSFDELTPEQQESLRGDTGPAGQDGVSPTVAFTSITGGNRMTVTDKDHPSGQSVDIMNGTNGQDGVSPAVTFTAITGGNKMTVTDETHPSGQSINIMNGTQGATGPAGPGVPSGGDAGQILVKASSTDYDGEWRNPFDGIQSVTVAGEDLDSYTTGGYYYFSGSYTPTNKPADSGTFGFLIVIKGTSNARLTQIWIDTASNVIYARTNSSSTVSWKSWSRLTEYATIEGAATLVDPLPTGVSGASVHFVQNGAVVQVYYGISRTSDAMTSWTSVATGLPAPAYTYTFNSYSIPLGYGFVAGAQSGRPLQLFVGRTGNSRGHLRISRGETEGMYMGTFTYITDEI